MQAYEYSVTRNYNENTTEYGLSGEYTINTSGSVDMAIIDKKLRAVDRGDYDL
jgi:hypothetical protein